ncbi:MarR family winged helix-turn-helix transcriptional regulator [Tessaracoccus sp. OH4464_COT-324]|uniref:MarR family winged helix-turn-helix transcriptional regulator n=1 Tax=Tessaracoccus sp. OH4464_COT-324 TaxID=2491059 RepID=UPI000F62DEB4|nr:MarR family transcriptional regulator [Tessaracoccus sp. OH4464_COT-324]RRD46986.1 MarR family transcriptional regulator [Tessaracoccus sp. OH4464_COT-324]
MNDTRRLANRVRLACQLVSYKVRFESGSPVSPHQLVVLWNLKDGPKTAGELAELERVTAPSMTKTLDQLEAEGYISRLPDPADRRRRIVTITELGRAQLDEAAVVRDCFMSERLRTLSPEDRATLERAAEILERVIG